MSKLINNSVAPIFILSINYIESWIKKVADKWSSPT